MAKYYICAFLLFISINGLSQKSDQYLIDSIGRTNPGNMDSLYYNLFVSYRLEDPNLAEEYAVLAYQTSISSGDNNYLIRALNALGYLQKNKSNFEEAIQSYTEAIDIGEREQFQDRLVYLYNNRGNIYTTLSRFDLAIDNYLQSLKYARKTENVAEQVIALNNIGLINYKLENFEEAIEYYLDAIELRRAYNLLENINITYINLALCYNSIGNRQEAINSFNSVLKNTGSADSKVILKAYSGLGKTYFDLNRDTEAERYFNLAKDLAENEDDLKELSSIEYYLAYLQFRQGHTSQAIAYLDNSHQKAKAINSKERLKNNLELYSLIHEENSDYLHAFQSLKQFISYKDSIFNEELAENLKDAHVKYQESLSEEIIAGQKRKIQKSNQFAFLLGLSFLLTVIIAILLFRNNQYRKKMNEKLDKLVKDRTNELKTTNDKLIKSRGELNNFLYKTSHDIRGPISTLIGLTNLTRLEYPNENLEFLLKKIDATAEHLNEIIGRLTIISHINTQPVSVVRINLFEMINNIFQECEKQFNKMVRLKISGDPPDYLYSDKILIEYILYSVISNSFKYTDDKEPAPYIELSVTKYKNELNILIKDNGIGIDKKYSEKIFELFFVANEKDHGAGIGLYQAMLAVERLNGSIQLKKIRKPTIFSIRLINVQPEHLATPEELAIA